jgi:hypothetical protein
MSQPVLSPKLARAAQMLDKGQVVQARTLLQESLRADPGNIWANQLMRMVMTRLGELDAALYYAQRAYKGDPNHPDSANLLAGSLANLGRMEEAEATLRASLDTQPMHPMNQAALAGVLARAGRFPECLEVGKKAIERGLPAPAVVGPVSTAMLMLGQGDQAAALLRQAHQQSPGDAMLLSTLCSVMLLAPGVPEFDIAGAHHAFGRLLVRAMPAHNEPARDPGLPGRAPRLGVCLGALETGVLACSIEPTLDALAEAAGPLRVYTHAPIDPAVLDRLKARENLRVVDLSRLAPPAASRRMLDDKLDALLDMAGHTAPGALPVLHLRGAPVQVSMLAYPCATGVQSIDGRLTDSRLDPDDSPGAGRLVRLERPAACFVAPAGLPEPGPCPSASAPDNAVTFGCITQAQRLNDPMVRLLASTVRPLAGARLVVHNPTLRDESCRTHLLRRLEASGLSPSRVELVGPVGGLSERAALFSRVDVALDTAPMPGVLEACLALHMGVPVVTLSGQTASRRQNAPVLAAAGLESLIASDEEAYMAAAQGLARDASRRAALRSGLRATLAASPLADASGLARSLIHALRAL